MYELKVKKERRYAYNCNVIFKDSFNLAPMALSALIPAFGLNDISDKGWFPHLANKSSNFGITLPCLPPKSDYMCDGMMPGKRQAFDEWYEANKHQPFELDEELPSYCLNDVVILMNALVALRKEFLEVSTRPKVYGPNNSRNPHDGIDVLRDCLTIASVFLFFLIKKKVTKNLGLYAAFSHELFEKRLASDCAGKRYIKMVKKFNFNFLNF